MTVDEYKAMAEDDAVHALLEFLIDHEEVKRKYSIALSGLHSSSNWMHVLADARPETWSRVYPKPTRGMVILGKLGCGCVVACDMDDTPEHREAYLRRGYQIEVVPYSEGMKRFMEAKVPCQHRT